jgi:hypothetical protein
MSTSETVQPVPSGEQTMNALRFHGQKDLRFEKIPIPEVKPGQVKIKPAWVGICGSGTYDQLNTNAMRLTQLYTSTSI